MAAGVGGVLYTDPGNIHAYKALIAAQYSGADLKVAPNFVSGETNKSIAYLRKFPLGRVPAYESEDSKVLLTESNAIAYYVSNEALRGRNVAIQTQVWQWTLWADNILLPAANAWVFPYLGKVKFDEQDVERAKADLLAALQVLESHLLTRTFLVIETVTLADIAVFSTLLLAFQHVLDPTVRLSMMRVQHWFKSLACHPQVASVVGQVALCAAPPVRHSTLFAHSGPTLSKDAIIEEKKPEKKERRKKKKGAAESDGESEGGKEWGRPLAALPAGTFDMDSFKKCYSNEDVITSIQYFWQTFDPQHYSIWFATYKYPEELTKVLTSCNLINGMFQQLESMRKHAFASVCVFGKDGDCGVAGVWVWRGLELAFPLARAWQTHYESYDWKKLDPASKDTKKLVQDYFSWSGTDGAGREFNQGKIFK